MKAKQFILNFRDSIYKDNRTPSATPGNSPPPSIGLELSIAHFDHEDDGSGDQNSRFDSDRALFEEELKDKWALRYLAVSYVHPIIEAMDEDCSGYISVKEANKFAKARPPGRRCVCVWLSFVIRLYIIIFTA